MSHQATATMDAESPAVAIVGASARALASSAAAAGWRVSAVDLFGDVDLRAVARMVDCVADAGEAYPASLATALAGLPDGPWCYVGALENHPDLIDAISMDRRLAGNDGRRVRAVRDVARLAAAVRSIGLGFPETFSQPAGIPTDGSYLIKPAASAGGRGITPWQGGAPPSQASLWQRRLAGCGVSASFASSSAGSHLMGIVHHHTGLPWCHAGEFAFCAAVRGTAQTPLPGVTAAVVAQFTALGGMLAERFELVGAIGVDAIIDADGRLWVVEVNPRPTSSMELYERATGESVAVAHLAGCGLAVAPFRRSSPPPQDVAWAKAVVHAPRDIEITTALADRCRQLAEAWTAADGGWAALADIPAVPQTIRRGAPWLTVFAQAADPATAFRLLENRTTAIIATLPSPGEPTDVV